MGHYKTYPKINILKISKLKIIEKINKYYIIDYEMITENILNENFQVGLRSWQFSVAVSGLEV